MALFNYECDEVKRKVDEVSPNYPQLTTFEKEWLFFHKYHYIPGVPVELEYETVSVNPNGNVSNAIPFYYKSAILKGSTKYRDIDTGDILDTFDETKNLELLSVKMPVLKVTGKNLFEGFTKYNYTVDNLVTIKEINDETLKYTSALWNASILFYIPIIGGKRYSLSSKLTNVIADDFYFTDDNKNIIGSKFNMSSSITSPNEAKFLRWRVRNAVVNQECVVEKFQLEENSIATSYEPFKSNILTVNEDVTLRSNGDICDELNLLTGQLTQRIGEDGEVLSQEVVKTVDLTPLNIPYEGTNHYHLTSNIPCEAILEVPVVSTGKQTLEDINN